MDPSHMTISSFASDSVTDIVQSMLCAEIEAGVQSRGHVHAELTQKCIQKSEIWCRSGAAKPIERQDTFCPKREVSHNVSSTLQGPAVM